MCLYPRLIKNKKYTANKKNGGNVPVFNDIRTLYVPIACGKCIECMQAKSREWQVRMNEEIRTDKTGKFITLTFNEKSLKKLRKIVWENIKETKDNDEDKKRRHKILDNEVATYAVRHFLERWRKKFKKSIKHWLCTELGHENTERIHLHGILFTNESKETIEKIWEYGIIWIGNYVNEKTINYIIKYIHKTDADHPKYTPKILTSSGIGKNYFDRLDYKRNEYKENETKESYKYKNGTESSLPIYYRNKIYTEEERERLWIEKLDKKIRYVCGEKIEVKTEEDKINYMKLLEYYQQKNERLGYGNGKKEWDKSKYEENLKKIEE